MIIVAWELGVLVYKSLMLIIQNLIMECIIYQKVGGLAVSFWNRDYNNIAEYQYSHLHVCLTLPDLLLCFTFGNSFPSMSSTLTP